MSHTDPTKRHEFVLLFDVKDGNPNGDPDAGNLPRMDPESQKGLVTDVCIKRKIRDYVAGVLGKPIFIQSETALNTLIFQAASKVGIEPPQAEVSSEALLEWLKTHLPDNFELQGNRLIFVGEKPDTKKFKKVLLVDLEDDELKAAMNDVLRELGRSAKGKGIGDKERKKTREGLISDYYDIRMFGAVLSTGLNAGQVRGPMQLTFARSVDKITAMDPSITRVAITREEDKARKQTEMGRKPFVPYGLYRAHGFFNPFLAKKTGVNEQDLKDFWEAIEKMFEFDRSASRGQMTTRGLFVFTHENEKGNAPSHKLLDLVTVQRLGKPAEEYEDYKGKGRIASLSSGPLEAFPGVTLTVLVEP